MQDSTLAALENLFLALSDKTRLRLLALMANGEVTVGFLADSLGETQPKISRHLAYLRGAGVVSTRKDGKWVYYAISTLNDPAAESALQGALSTITGRVIRPMPAEPVYDEYAAPGDEDIYASADMNEWRPAEIDIFLL